MLQYISNPIKLKEEIFSILDEKILAEFTKKKKRFTSTEKLASKKIAKKNKIAKKIQSKKDRKKVGFKKYKIRRDKMAKRNKTSTGKFLTSKAK